MLWPTGVLQDEIDVAANKPASFLELDRRGSSCPTLFAWNGEKYEFITDVIGAGVIGHWISPVAKNTPDPDEWVKIDGSKLRAKDGYLSVRFGEPMEEVNYIDQLRMVAVDHPADVDVYPDERFLDDPPFASGKTVATSQPHPPAGAWDNQGHDVLQLVSARDHQYVRDFTNLPYAGFANTHSLTLDLGTWTPQQPLRLFLSGFIEYFSATSMYAAWQAGLKPISPYIEAQMPDGSWQRVVDEMGFPAGLPRTITVDLTGKLPAGAQKIRITSNLQIYWDEVLVDNGPARESEVRTTELPLAAATLGFRGYPRQVDGETPGDLTYRYEEASTTGPFSRFRGSYTQYGDVTPLLTSIDNHFAIFGTGEDIDAEFDTAALPALPQGWKRDYFFYANGFVKDMDFYEAIPFTVAEMPFHGMSTYPYPTTQHYPDDAQANGYRFDWNDRFESGASKARGYRFVYNTRTIDPEPLTPHKKLDTRRRAHRRLGRTRMKKLATLSIAALTISAIYLYAWPAPNVFYAARGAVSRRPGRACSASADCALLPTAMRQPCIVKLATLVLIVGAALGLALIYTGASRPYTKLLLSHGAVSFLAVALLAGWWYSRRKESSGSAWVPALGAVAVAVVVTLGAQYARTSWSKRYVIRNPEMAPLSMNNEGDGVNGNRSFPVRRRWRATARSPRSSSWSPTPASAATRTSSSSGTARRITSRRSTISGTARASSTCRT